MYLATLWVGSDSLSETLEKYQFRVLRNKRGRHELQSFRSSVHCLSLGSTDVKQTYNGIEPKAHKGSSLRIEKFAQ